MSETKLIMIDDTDPSISYTGNWVADKGSVDNLGNYGAPYMSTNHFIKGTGSFTFTFSGTYVGVFGTTVDSTNPNRQCTVDGTNVPTSDLTVAENGVMQCQIDGLANTQHTLVVTVPTPNPSGYWFDYIFYIPSASVSETNAVLTYLVGDPSFNFDSGWSTNGPGMITNTNGATFTMQFTGRTLIWLGFYLSANAFTPTTATWSIDGGAPVSFNLNGAASQQTGAEFNQRFFSTGVLSGNQHTLKVVYNGNSGTTPLSIYQVLVQNGNTAGQDVGGVAPSSVPAAPASPASSSSSQGSSAPSPSSANGGSIGPTPTTGGSHSSTVVVGSGSAAITVTVGSGNFTDIQSFPTGISALGSPTGTSGAGSSSPSGSGGASGTNHNGSNSADTSGSPGATGASGSSNHTVIIAGVLGGVIALLLLLFIVCFLLRRKNKRRAVRTTGVPEPITHVVQPFTDLPSTAILSEAAPTRSGAISPTTTTEYSSSSSNYQSTPFVPGQLYTDEKRQPLPSHAQSPSLSTAFSSSNGRPESEFVMMHQDSGVRLPPAQGGRTVLEMPPSYSAD